MGISTYALGVVAAFSVASCVALGIGLVLNRRGLPRKHFGHIPGGRVLSPTASSGLWSEPYSRVGTPSTTSRPNEPRARRRRPLTADQQATRDAWARKRARQMGAHALAVPSRQTLGEWLDQWWAMESPLWARSTRVRRKDVLDRWVRPQIGKVRLSELGRKRVNEWRAAITADGCKPTQANQALSVLSAALTASVANGELPANPCRGVKRIPVRVSRPHALTPEEVEQGMAGMRLRNRVMVQLVCYAGLRPGEALALRWGDVRGGLLIIDRSYSYGELKDTKTHQRRTVDVVAPLAEELAALRPARPARDALVVASITGGFLDLNNWRRRVWKAAYPDSSPYDGRHTYASLLIHEGRSLPYVTAALGHSTAKTTLDHYAHVYAEAQLGTAVRMVDAITTARQGVLKTYSNSEPRRLRPAAPQ